MRFLKRNWFLIVSLVVLVVAVFYVFVLGAGREVYVFGYKPFIVASGSMEPELRTHALAVAKRQAFTEAQANEVAVFRIDERGQLASHRVVEIRDEGLVTKGDSNPMVDLGYVSPDRYVGKIVWHSNAFAAYFDALLSPGGWVKFLLLPVLLLVVLVAGLTFGLKALRRKSLKQHN